MGAPVTHFEIGGKNGKKLQEFYAKLFDWEITAMPDMQTYGMVNTGGKGGINGGIYQSQPGQPPMITFYIEVPDVAAHLKKIEAAGGKTVMPVTVVPGMVTFALFADPEGNVVGIAKMEKK